MTRQVKQDALYVSSWSINLVHSYNDWYPHASSNLNDFDCLRLDTLNSRDYKNDYVCYLCTAYSEIIEGLVSWSIDKGDLITCIS